MKASEIADYSVGTVWHVQGDNYYLLDLIRNRFDFSDLKRAVMRQKEQWPSAHILIEDKGSGTSLIQELRHQQIAVISINCKDDKVTRLFSTQPRFESGSVHFPEQAPWLDDLITEFLAFPHGRHDDQVDSIAQALAWLDQRKRSSGVVIASIERFRPMDDSSEPLNEFLNRRQDHERAILAAIEFLKQLIAETNSPIAEPCCKVALEHCRALRDDECFKYLGMALTWRDAHRDRTACLTMQSAAN